MAIKTSEMALRGKNSRSNLDERLTEKKNRQTVAWLKKFRKGKWNLISGTQRLKHGTAGPRNVEKGGRGA